MELVERNWRQLLKERTTTEIQRRKRAKRRSDAFSAITNI
jgi:hypothetical protein